ncbi:MAG: hypothetical protein V7L00_16245 [Nostoc sp.]|uniref:hypothetical protein n=1 Tax=Nostoc sp. TaxID=1180 RepID=UPI002FF78768
MESTLFTKLTVSEEANLSGGNGKTDKNTVKIKKSKVGVGGGAVGGGSIGNGGGGDATGGDGVYIDD